MKTIMLLLIVTIVTLGLIFRRSRLVTVLLALLIWVLMGLNTNSPDFVNYYIRFHNIDYNSKIEWGYCFFNLFARLLKLDFQQFRMLYAALFTAIAIGASYRLSEDPNFVLAMFVFWPFPAYISGLRIAMSAVIVCFGLPYLFSKGKHKYFKYILCVLIAGAFHVLAYFYLVFVFANIKYNRKQLTIIFFTITILSVAIVLDVPKKFSCMFSRNSRISKWITSNEIFGIRRMSFINFSVTILPLCAIAITSSMMHYKLTNESHEVEKQALLSDNLTTSLAYKNIFLLSLLSLPFYIITHEFSRLIYGVLMVYYAQIAQFSHFTKRPQNSINKLLLSCYIAIIAMVSLYVYRALGTHNIIETLTSNLATDQATFQLFK
ncbi:MAG: EpsG family protein [Christensenellales bacterium]